MILTALLAFVAFVLLNVGLMTLNNLLFFPRLAASPRRSTGPRLSFLVPARDEAITIGRIVGALLGQDYLDFEVVVLDDDSTDGTAERARVAGAGDARLRVLTGRPLPAGWLGKNWACAQLAEAATGDVLVFADADTRWEPGAATALAAEMEREAADLLSIWPTQGTVTWAERLVVPIVALAILGFLPALAAHVFPWRALGVANGQCLVFRRAAYEAVGGHAAVAGSIVEDVALARRIKAHGLRLRLADAQGLIGCRMYDGWPAVRDGFAKIIVAGYGGSVLFVLAATVFHWLAWVLPWVLWPFDWRFALLAAVGVIIRAVTASFTRQRIGDAVLMPLSVVLVTVIAVHALRWHFGDGPRWKGRAARV